MIEIKCPRCEQYWYDNDEEAGRVRLCSRCADHLRRKSGHRVLIDIPFLIGAGMFLFIDLMLIALTALEPRLFGKVMLGYGGLLLLGGMLALRGIRWEKGSNSLFSWFEDNIDWKFGRWALLLALSGLACVLAYASLVGLRK